MIKLIGLNLLPYREIERKKKLDSFKRFMGLCVLAGIVAAGVVWFLLSQAISNQEDRNSFLKSEIAKLDEQIKEVDRLEQRKREFIARKEKIEELQHERYQVAMMFNDLNRIMPEGAFLTHIQSNDGKTYNLTGVALSDSKVASFMRALPSTGVFSVPQLVEIKTEKGVQRFTVSTRLMGKAGSQQDKK
ncbi:MAG: PilN domain-containing protein [Neisseriaceae bacterium]|nr:PilN domain-containing protein [Neisseriaceae bacterium]